jgi:hypothetical protein
MIELEVFPKQKQVIQGEAVMATDSTYLCYRPDEEEEDEAQLIDARSAYEAAKEYCRANEFDEEDEFDVSVKLVGASEWQKFLVVREVEVTYVAYPQ